MDAGGILGTKLVLNEFIGYLQMVAMGDQLGERSQLILTYALCSLPIWVSLGILIGGLGVLVPERRAEILKAAPKSHSFRHHGHDDDREPSGAGDQLLTHLNRPSVHARSASARPPNYRTYHLTVFCSKQVGHVETLAFSASGPPHSTKLKLAFVTRFASLMAV